jgi:hypothetical protein
MKISALFIIIAVSTIFSQQQESVSVLELEQEIKNSSFQNTSENFSSYNNPEQSKKSAGLAVIYSLLLPGMGELYADGYHSGKYFTIAEGALWGTYLGMSIHASNQKDNYKAFASANASIDNNGKDDTFYATIGEYQSVESYNNEKALERSFGEMYSPNAFFWNWQSTEARRTYRNIWSSSEQTYNDLRFVVGAMLLNRVISAINAVRLVAVYNNRLEEELSWNVSVGFKNYVNLPTSINLNFYTSL